MGSLSYLGAGWEARNVATPCELLGRGRILPATVVAVGAVGLPRDISLGAECPLALEIWLGLECGGESSPCRPADCFALICSSGRCLARLNLPTMYLLMTGFVCETGLVLPFCPVQTHPFNELGFSAL